MDSSLQSLSKIFTEKLFRIPDYQRGYAWTEKQLKDFWNDLIQLEKGKNHYIGVLTVEKVNKTFYEKWEDDVWIIESKSFEPLYVVDGQQRLTTSLILIQSITEFIPDGEKLSFDSIDEIRKKFIFNSKDNGISRSYIFGYEKDNPSYDYLKCKIFDEDLEEFSSQHETVYTNNLESAKKFFTNELSKLKIEEIEVIYKKLTQNFLFNSYTISSDIDVFVAFESMNNRGKPLSYLELLKNRLIYLSTKFNVSDSEKNKLRKRVNECWKSIYHNLGRNKLEPLADDVFLQNHFLIYFSRKIYEKEKKEFKDTISYQRYITLRRNRDRLDYPTFLLETHFITKNLNNKTTDYNVTINDIYKYVNSLQKSVESWYKIFNPKLSKGFTKEETYWLEKINRRGIRSVAPLIMVFFAKEKKEKKRIQLLKAIEKYLFAVSVLTYRDHYLLHNSDFLELATDMIDYGKSSDVVISIIVENNNKIYNSTENKKSIIKTFKSNGFYDWDGVRYFMYEYDLSLFETSKTKRVKLDWKSFVNSDYRTVEHIYPQNARKKCWIEPFKKYTSKEKSIIRHSLGNLLPLSQPKNSSFQNNCFIDKVGNEKNTIGYRYGCYSENEITELEVWGAIQILERGLKLLSFMENRWGIHIGDVKAKIKFLSLDFVLVKEKIKMSELTTANKVYKSLGISD